MKILVVQLLRLGDILFSAPIVSALKKKYPSAEIHFLGFKNFSAVEKLFEGDIHWHWLDRNALQTALRDADEPFFGAQDLLQRQLKPLRSLHFDHIFNLTQTLLSGRICQYLLAEQITGLHYDSLGIARFGSPWFQYLNDHVTAGSGEIFHFVDIFRFGCELEAHEAAWSFKREPLSFNAPPKPYVLIQPLTSDSKKNYPLKEWRRAIEMFQTAAPNRAVGILAAPSEVDMLNEAFAGMAGVQVLPCTLGQALTLMDQADLLVTGDTSIKHLSCASMVPVLELSLGSSDYRKTGVYKTGSWILRGKTACSPCPHSGPCSQASHLCSALIPPEAVSLAMHGLLTNANTITSVAREFGPQTEWLETYLSPMGFWMPRDLKSNSVEWELLQCIEKSTWKFLLQREFLNPVAPFGTESLRIRKTFQERFADFAVPILKDQLDFLENETAAADKTMNVILNSMDKLLARPLDALHRDECLDSVRSFCESENGTNPFAINWLRILESESIWPGENETVTSIHQLRKLQTQLDEVVHRTQIKLKLIRSLKSQVTESI